jgi:hypothetical protein
MITPFIDKNEITPWSKMIVITGVPGARTDFLAGWISNGHPDQLTPMFWRIIPGIGRSNISTPVILHSLSSSNYVDTINFLVGNYWKDDALWVVSKSHRSSSELQNLIPVEHASKFIFVDLLVDTPEAALQVQWETFAKNILWNYNNNSGLGRTNLSWFYQIPEEFNDIEALTAGFDYLFSSESLEAVLCNYDNKSVSVGNFKVIPTEYSKIMKPNGAIELANKLGIIDVNIDLWNTRLPEARSPDRIFALDHWWEKPSYPLQRT